jgi:hypothetical protein
MRARCFRPDHTVNPYHIKLILSLLALSLTLLPYASNAQGNLLITPRRVVFEGARKTQELNLANTGKDTARYIVSLIEIRMKEDGSFERITDPDSGQLFASHYLRFFPRTVTLAPNEAQVVKVQLRNASMLQPGEYRSHVYFRAAPEDVPLGEPPPPPSDPNSISVKVTPVFGISIPVIIRVGVSDTKVSIANVSVESDSIPVLRMSFLRTGNMSCYGDVTVDYITEEGRATRLTTVKGISVYTPNAKRDILIELDKSKKLNYKKGKIRIVYSAQKESGGETMAETEVLLE